MATFLELQNRVLRACGHTTAASSEPRTRIKAELNDWQRRLLTRPGYSRLLRDSVNTFVTVADKAVYGLGIPMGRILGIHQRDNEVALALQNRAWLRRNDPGLTSSGSPASAYIPLGWFPVQTQPANASGIYAKSAEVLDTTQVVDWEFITSSMQRITGNTTLNGTTAVQLGSATTVVEVVKLSLRTAATGVVTVHEDSGSGSTLLTLPIGQQFGRFLHVQLWPTPSAADVTYHVDYTREIVDMAQDTDIPLLPPDYHHILALGSEFDEWRKLSDDRMVVAKQDLEQEIKSLNAWLWDPPDDTMGEAVGRSRLGGWFPAGS